MRKVLAIAFVFVPLTLSCAEQEAPPEAEIDLDAERAGLLETDRGMAEAYASSETPLDTLFTYMAEDTRVLAPDSPLVEGKAGTREMWEALVSLPGFSLTFTPTTAEVGGAADLGYTIGTYSMTLPGPDGNVVRSDGKYLTVWERDPDGAWKIAVDMFNADGPPVPAGEQEPNP